jgi:hypothetical protein
MPSCSKKQDKLPAQEDHEARFYERHRKLAKEHEKDFLKKYDEDLGTTLIFVSVMWGFAECPLTSVSGRSVFGRRLHVYHSPASA